MHRARYGGRVRSAGRCPILPESLYVRYLDAPCLLYRGHGGRGGLSWLGMHRACTGGAPPLRGQRATVQISESRAARRAEGDHGTPSVTPE